MASAVEGRFSTSMSSAASQHFLEPAGATATYREPAGDEQSFVFVPSSSEMAEYYPRRSRIGVLAVRERIHARGSALLMELWLFLQFVVILVSFVWTMASRGPRAVVSGTNTGKEARVIR
jgi:hypothetical protein